MARKKLTEERIAAMDEQITKECIPYTYDTKQYPAEVIISKYNKGQLFVPHYQRNFVWTPKQKSKFIESVFLGVPIMPFLVSISGDEAELEIIDGSQRIRTLLDYCSNQLKLSSLEKLTELNNTIFDDLSETRQNKFLLRDFRLHVVTENAQSETRADIFNRVNTSFNKLSPSEIRKGAYQGEFYNFIIECSKTELFRTVCPIPEQKANRGEYEELALRFFAYSDSYLDFKHDVSPFLDNYLKRNRNNFDSTRLSGNFNRVVNFIQTHFLPPYLARRGRDNATPRVRFEAITIGIHLALIEDSTLVPDNLNWLESREFKMHTTSDASNNQGKLKGRIEFVRDCLLGNITNDELTYD